MNKPKQNRIRKPHKAPAGFITKIQAAEVLACTVRSVDEKMKQGRIVFYKFGRRVLFKERELIQCIENHIVRIPAMPNHIRDWLMVNDDVPPKKLKCPTCGEWFSGIDKLAPYQWEACWCEKCQKRTNEP